MRVLADQGAAGGAAGDRGVEVGGEGRAVLLFGEGYGRVAVTLVHGGIVVLERNVSPEILERTGGAGGRHLRGPPVQRTDVAGVLREIEADGRTGVGVGVHLPYAESLLVRGQRGHFLGVGPEGVVVRQHHALVLGARPSVDGVAQERLVDAGAPAVRELDGGERRAGAGQFGAYRRGGGLSVVDDQDP